MTRPAFAMLTESEYIAGEIFVMAGASIRHNLIAVNLFAALASQF
jgi:Uma2 family endonuclease